MSLTCSGKNLFSGILHSSDYHLRNKKTFAPTVCLTCFLQALVARCVVRVQGSYCHLRHPVPEILERNLEREYLGPY